MSRPDGACMEKLRAGTCSQSVFNMSDSRLYRPLQFQAEHISLAQIVVGQNFHRFHQLFRIPTDSPVQTRRSVTAAPILRMPADIHPLTPVSPTFWRPLGLAVVLSWRAVKQPLQVDVHTRWAGASFGALKVMCRMVWVLISSIGAIEQQVLSVGLDYLGLPPRQLHNVGRLGWWRLRNLRSAKTVGPVLDRMQCAP